MNITIAQIVEARSGKTYYKKWPNGTILYTFEPTFVVEGKDIRLSQEERNIVKKVVKRFNKDFKGCASIK